MSHHPLPPVMDVIETLELPANLPAGQFYETIEPYFSDAEEDTARLEKLTVKVGKSATTTTVASAKLSNLKFRLKDLLLESMRTTLKVQSAKQNWLALTLVLLEFLQKLSGMMEYKLSTDEAHVLLAMYTLENDKEKITVDRLFAGLTAVMDESRILRSLELLEKLSCIQYGADELKLVETIVFVQE
ncbi:MAG: hypothetical protein ACOYYS_14880 [Chloroflexota bacterium]